MSIKETAKRYTLFVISLFFSALGIAFSKHANLGITTISSVANVLSIKFSFISLGNWLIIWNMALLLGQVIILRRNFKLVQLLQIPLSFLFGWFCDLGYQLVELIPADNYFVQLVLVIVGIAVLAFGITLALTADVIMNSGEAFVKAISDVSGWKFGNVKIAVDIGCVVLAVILSMMFFDFRIEGIREGTVISAFLIGAFVKLYSRFVPQAIIKLFRLDSSTK